MALDNWASIAAFAVPLVKEYGPKILTSLYRKFVPEKHKNTAREVA